MNINELMRLAIQHYQSGNLQQAEDLLKKILHVQSNNTTAINLLGIISYQLNNYDSAIQLMRKLINLNPNNAQAYYILGHSLQEKCEMDEAITHYQKSLQLNPNLSDAYYNLGTIFQDKKQYDEAISCYHKSLQLNPHDTSAYYNMGNTFRDKGQFEEALTCYRNALQLNPNLADAWSNIGTISQERGLLDEAELHYKLALTIEPDNVIIHQNRICSMLYNFHYDANAIFSAHVQFADRFAKPLTSSIIPHSNVRILNRRLKIGYVSPDFKKHSVSHFIEPVIAAHSRESCEIYCYYLDSSADEVTKRIQKLADHWRCIANTPDEQATEQIRNDKIDILVDLAGHSFGNRIRIFARKPAPIQINWIGYPATSGLSTIDYKIVDMHTDPVEMTETFYTENLIRLPECFLCYQPDKDSPDVTPPPVLNTGNVTFGSFNNFLKESPEVLTLWAKILRALHNSLLILKAKIFSDSKTRKYVLDFFAAEGIASERIQLLSWKQSTQSHLAAYNRIDIALDTFPYNGTTTTCEAMWMGVPVVTLAGNSHVSRVGLSLLSNVGLIELIAQTPDNYVSTAVDLAKDLTGLQSLREHLRDMMIGSPLCDAKKFTANLERCYRHIYEAWCRSV